MIKKELLSKNITDPSQASADELKEAKGIVREKFLAALMLNGANASKYGELKRSMAENYVTGTSEYPESPSPEVVLRILNAYQPPAGWNMNQRKQYAGAGTDEGAMFVQTDNDNWNARYRPDI
jgi:transcriptional regulator with XRE-family HTH domain